MKTQQKSLKKTHHKLYVCVQQKTKNTATFYPKVK